LHAVISELAFVVWPKGGQLAARRFANLYDHRFANLGFAGVELFGQPTRLIETALLWRTGAPGPGALADRPLPRPQGVRSTARIHGPDNCSAAELAFNQLIRAALSCGGWAGSEGTA
jgi:hypothetical protein